MLTEEIKDRLEKFAAYSRTLKGDEKGEAQLFLERFFLALGHAGVKEAGATLEFRIAKKPGGTQLELLKDEAAAASTAKPRAGGKKFADLLWPGRVLIEMKSRGQHLEKHYDQAFDYWSHIVPQRPPYVILCNFDELWIYDFNIQLFDPVDRIPMRELADRWSALGFLLPTPRKPIFDNNRVDVTRKAADRLAGVFKSIVGRGVPRARAQRFVLQLLLALVAEDLGLFRDAALIVTDILDECKKGGSAYDLLGGLFRQMADKTPAPEGRYVGVPYFNGGLFSVVESVGLKMPEIYALEDAAREDWSTVKPEIFGTLFQDSMDKEERHAFGAHFTSEFDIQKVVGPTIVRPWKERIEACRAADQLRQALADLRAFRVLDPACGSGNFLFVAYREMKRLERDILLRLRAKKAVGDAVESAVSIQQFFGIDKLPFAVELARVTLMLAKELELIEAAKLGETDGLFVQEKPLPLDNLDANIVCADALFTEWPKADAIIGNPPYLGAKLLKPEYGPDYVNKVRAAFPEVPGMADYCVYWFRKAHDSLPECTARFPTSGRAGLVGTQNVRNNQSRVGGLDYIVKSGTIMEAVDNQPWSGEANVHVSIVDWVKTKNSALLPPTRTLWTKADPLPGGKKQISDSVGKKLPLAKQIDLICRQPTYINSALSDDVDLTVVSTLNANIDPPCSFNGQMLGHNAFLLTEEQRLELIRDDPRSASVIFSYLNGREFLSGLGVPDRYVLDFGIRDQFEAATFAAAFTWVKTHVLPDRAAKAESGKDALGNVRPHHKAFLEHWWQLSFGRPELISIITKLPRYIACSLVSKRATFVFVSAAVRPSNLLQVFTFADDYSFGVLQSGIHWEWFKRMSSKLKSDYRYGEAIWNTFPWPQAPTPKHARAVADAAVALRALRRDVMGRLGYSLRDLYRTLDEPGANPLRDAHAKLDAAVRAAYAMPADADPLAFLLELNLACAAREKSGQPVTPPGLPTFVADTPEARAAFVTADCIQPPLLPRA